MTKFNAILKTITCQPYGTSYFLETAHGTFLYRFKDRSFCKFIGIGTYSKYSTLGEIELSEKEKTEIEETIQKNQFMFVERSYLNGRKILFNGFRAEELI